MRIRSSGEGCRPPGQLRSALLGAVALLAAGCAHRDVKLLPADSGDAVSVRFAQGDALMLSAGRNGAIALLPRRYDGGGGRMLFRIGGYNRSGLPVNFGPDDITVTLDDGAPLQVYDFDSLRHSLKLDNEDLWLRWWDKTIGFALVEGQGDRREAWRARRSVSAFSDTDFRLHAIVDNLSEATRAAETVLQTTTIDPQTYWSGWVVAAEPPLAPGQVHNAQVSVRFAGDVYQFHLTLAREGTIVRPEHSLRATPRSDVSPGLDRSQTWLWDVPPGGVTNIDLERDVVVVPIP